MPSNTIFENAIDFNTIFNFQNLIIYIVIINLITFLVMFLDKKKAQKGKFRISESFLFTLVFLGGGIGGIAGMYIFRHKTKKPMFIIGFPLILTLEIIILIYYTFFILK